MPDQLEVTTNELLSRGWTRTLIKRFLPRPDGCTPVNHWANFRGQDTYAVTKVRNVEQSEEFGTAFLKSWKGRAKGRMQGKLPEHVLDELRSQPHPRLPERKKDDVLRDTAIAEAASLFGQLRARGYRTPHKC